MALVRLRRVLVTVTCGLLAAACSGGGSGGGDGDPTASLTGANAEDVTGAVVRSVVVSSEIGGELDGGLPGGAGGGAGAGATARKLEGPRGGSAPGPVTRAPFGPDTEPCDVDGVVTLSGDFADPDVVSVGDFVNADFELCDDGNVVLDGGLDITIDALTGTLFEGDFSAVLGLVMRMFSIDDGVTMLVLDGDGDLSLDFTMPLVSVIGMSGSSLEISDGVETALLTNYSTVVEADEDAMTYVLRASGRMEHSAFAGSVDYDTEVDLIGDEGADPDDGLLVIHGALDAFIEVIPDPNGVDVDLFVDLDGNGTPDSLVETTWDALLGV